MNEENILQNSLESEAVVPLSNASNSENLSTENVESTEVLETGTLADADLVADVQQIAGDVRFLLLFVLLSFCWSAIRAWRRNMSGGVK